MSAGILKKRLCSLRTVFDYGRFCYKNPYIERGANGCAGGDRPQHDRFNLVRGHKNEEAVEMLGRAVLYENLPLLAIGLALGGAIGAATVGAIAPCKTPAFERALSRASEAVAIGQRAPQLEPSEALEEWQTAEQLWTEALAELALVRQCSQNYDAARERLDSYKGYRQRVEGEIAKLSAR